MRNMFRGIQPLTASNDKYLSSRAKWSDLGVSIEIAAYPAGARNDFSAMPPGILSLDLGFIQ